MTVCSEVDNLSIDCHKTKSRVIKCVVPEYIHTPTTVQRIIAIPRGSGDLKGQNFLKESMSLNWNFQRGGGFKPKKPSEGGVWIFSGTTYLITQSGPSQQNVSNAYVVG